MLRLFTGLELPEDVQDELSALNEPLPGAKWVDADDLHVTLRFAGDIDNGKAREFSDGLAHIDVSVFELRINGLGCFGGNDPRIIFANLEPSAQLDALARAHERAARNAGLPPESRAFKGHVTLARLNHTRPDEVARYLQKHAAYQSRPFMIEQFVMFSSRPRVGGGPYVVEDVYPLQGSLAWTGGV
jgi:RNA 2',3'-cyclic 3'-phosphodiesterase